MLNDTSGFCTRHRSCSGRAADADGPSLLHQFILPGDHEPAFREAFQLLDQPREREGHAASHRPCCVLGPCKVRRRLLLDVSALLPDGGTCGVERGTRRRKLYCKPPYRSSDGSRPGQAFILGVASWASFPVFPSSVCKVALRLADLVPLKAGWDIAFHFKASRNRQSCLEPNCSSFIGMRIALARLASETEESVPFPCYHETPAPQFIEPSLSNRHQSWCFGHGLGLTTKL